jgi:hypothetical protein
MSQPLVKLWPPMDLQELQELRPQLELLLEFCDADQLIAAGISPQLCSYLLSADAYWSDADMMAVLEATNSPIPYSIV